MELNLETQELITKTISSAEKAHAFLQANNLEKPLIEVSKGFINWFGGLFTRTAHKKRVLLMEKLEASQEDISVLEGELKLLLEENEGLKTEFEEHVASMQTELEKTENQKAVKAAVTIINSRNVVTGDVNVKEGGFRVGDNYGTKEGK